MRPTPQPRPDHRVLPEACSHEVFGPPGMVASIKHWMPLPSRMSRQCRGPVAYHRDHLDRLTPRGCLRGDGASLCCRITRQRGGPRRIALTTRTPAACEIRVRSQRSAEHLLGRRPDDMRCRYPSPALGALTIVERRCAAAAVGRVSSAAQFVTDRREAHRQATFSTDSDTTAMVLLRPAGDRRNCL